MTTIGDAGKDSAWARMRSGLDGRLGPLWGGVPQLRVDGVQPQKLRKKIFEPV